MERKTSSISLLMAPLVLFACTFATLKAERLCKANLPQQESSSHPWHYYCYYHSCLESSSCYPLSPLLSPAIDAAAVCVAVAVDAAIAAAVVAAAADAAAAD